MNIKLRITTQENAKTLNVPINTIVDIDFEEYIATVVMSEIGTSNLEAAKAQAVAARTYAVFNGVLDGKVISDSSNSAQAYRVSRYQSGKYPICIQGTQETAGQVLVYNGKPINAVFSNCNGGRTYSAKEVWGGNKVYLVAQPDPWDAATGKKKDGHGVGMSQTGCKWAAKYGIGYKEILSFYYPNTVITQLSYNDELKKLRSILAAAIEEL